ncbi:MAG: hypothetical protein U0L20_06070 [Ruminococcus sp.]|nr:hypothetical protein [Ruminococcus sp.]
MLRELREQYNYYYVDGHFNLNDLIITIVFAMFSVAFIAIYFIEGVSDPDFESMMMLIMPIFMLPFVIFYIYRIIKIVMFKRKFKLFTEKGTALQGIITGEKEGKKIFEDKNTGIERYFYHPEIMVRKGSEEILYKSKYAVNNSYRYALESEIVGVYEYKGEYLIYDVQLAETEFSSINTFGKTTDEDKAIIIVSALSTIVPLLIVLLRRFLIYTN